MSTFLSITSGLFNSVKTRGTPPIVLCDFDGTISLKDVTDTLLSHFGREGCEELEQQWLAGKIGSQECMSKQIALMDASFDEMNQVLSEIEIDPTFKEFIDYTKKRNIPVHIVSDGLDYAIKTIFKHNNLGDLPIFANRLLHDNERGWKLEFPYANKNCIKGSGNCKCNHVKKQQHYSPILYVGDGTSDYCVSHHVDIVFAKDKLINYCQENKIAHYSIQCFSDVVEKLDNLECLLLPTLTIE